MKVRWFEDVWTIRLAKEIKIPDLGEEVKRLGRRRLSLRIWYFSSRHNNICLCLWSIRHIWCNAGDLGCNRGQVKAPFSQLIFQWEITMPDNKQRNKQNGLRSWEHYKASESKGWDMKSLMKALLMGGWGRPLREGGRLSWVLTDRIKPYQSVCWPEFSGSSQARTKKRRKGQCGCAQEGGGAGGGVGEEMGLRIALQQLWMWKERSDRVLGWHLLRRWILSKTNWQSWFVLRRDRHEG